MFSWRHKKFHEPLEELEEGGADQPAENGALGGEALSIEKAVQLEGLINELTKGLSQAKNELMRLPNVKPVIAEQGKGEPAKDGLIVQTIPAQAGSDAPADGQSPSPDEEDGLDALLEIPAEQEEVKKPDKESKKESEEESSSLAGFFSEEEEEENPLLGLITALPEVSARELLDEAQEITSIVLARKRG